jgi:hypothetical protein
MYRLLKAYIEYALSLLVDLAVRPDINEDDLVFKLNINNTNITRYRECTPTLHAASKRMIVDGCITMSGNKHIYTFIVLLAEFFILCDTLRVACILNLALYPCREYTTKTGMEDVKD